MNLDKDLPVDVRSVLETAGLLEVSEFRVFEMAFAAWFGRPSDDRLERVFTAYMYGDRVPHWVRAFTREVVERGRTGMLDPADYGIVHRPPTPTMIYLGIRYAVWAALTLAVIILGAYYMEAPTGCMLPPCY